MNTTTKAQRINKRQDAIWEKAKSLANPPKAKRAAQDIDERIINATAKAIGPVHLPSKRETEKQLDQWTRESQPRRLGITADKPAHTPEPWTYSAINGDNYVMARRTGEPATMTVACVMEHGEVLPQDEADANKRLIAAAPTMLQALKDLTAQIQLGKLNIRKDFSLMNAHAAATKAIFQAEGNT